MKKKNPEITKNKFYQKLAEYEDYHNYKGSVGRPLKKITREDLWNYVSQQRTRNL